MGRTGLTLLRLLLALSFLVHCARPDDSTVLPAETLAPGATSAPDAPDSPSPAPADPTTAAPSPAVSTENKLTTKAPLTTAAPTTAVPPDPPAAATTIATAKPTTLAPAVASEKPSASSGGGDAVQTPLIITTVSKLETGPTTTGPKSDQSSPSAAAMGSTPAQTPPGAATTLLPVQTTAPKTGPSATDPPTPGATGTTRASNDPAPATTATRTIDATTKRDAKQVSVAGTTAVVTSKSSPERNLGPTGSTAAPVVPQTPNSQTSKPPTTATGQVPVSTTESSVRTTEAPPTAPPTTATTAAPAPRVFSYSLNKGHQSEEEKELVSLCQRLMGSLEDGNCTVSFRHHNDKVLFDFVEITGKVKTTIVTQHFEDITKKPTDNRTLITILASCGALLIMIIILAVCASHHRKPYSENQLHLTEELQTVENGYHDNPTLEVMEVGGDAMQEKKKPPPLALNNGGDFNDSWIVPIDNLLKEEGPDEEDTHL